MKITEKMRRKNAACLIYFRYDFSWAHTFYLPFALYSYFTGRQYFNCILNNKHFPYFAIRAQKKTLSPVFHASTIVLGIFMYFEKLIKNIRIRPLSCDELNERERILFCLKYILKWHVYFHPGPPGFYNGRWFEITVISK